MALVFDTETSGLPEREGNKYAPYQDLSKYDNARIVSIAFMFGEEESYFLIRPDFEITNSHIHGITKDQALKDGVSFQEVVTYLDFVLDRVDTLVGHNIEFDYNILLSELYRLGGDTCQELIAKLQQKKKYCTMKESIMICRIKNKFGRFKYPKLIELYQHFFNDSFDAHHALNDTRATYQCYKKLLQT
jgi:DNA polymerase-3 subunit alpha